MGLNSFTSSGGNSNTFRQQSQALLSYFYELINTLELSTQYADDQKRKMIDILWVFVKISLNAKTTTEINDIWEELGNLLSELECGTALVPIENTEPIIDNEAFSIALSNGLISILHTLSRRVEKVAMRIEDYPELKKRWNKTLIEIVKSIEILNFSFTDLRTDTRINWREVRDVFETQRTAIDKIEGLVEGYIRLKEGKRERVGTIIGENNISSDTPLIPAPAIAAQGEGNTSGSSEFGVEKVQRNTIPKNNSVGTLEKRNRRKGRILKHVFQKDIGWSPENPFAKKENIEIRLKQMQDLFGVYGLKPKEVEEMLMEDAKKRNSTWIRENYIKYQQNPQDVALRRELECALYYFGENIEPINYEGLIENKKTLEILTPQGKFTIHPPFRKNTANHKLYGDVFIGGQKTLCRFDPDTLKVHSVFTLDILDRDNSTWKSQPITPILIWQNNK